MNPVACAARSVTIFVLAIAAAVLPGCAVSGSGRSAVSASDAAVRAAALTKDQVAGAWERLKSLEGSWVGRSTKGWTERVDYKLIAKDSCLVETSFDAHPNETMLTTWCRDGDRIVLTHYCVARNQPRLVLTGVGGDALTFEFLDATNLASRDVGHMDKLVMTFTAEGFTDQWTWYQEGEERWMEKIEHKRAGT